MSNLEDARQLLVEPEVPVSDVENAVPKFSEEVTEHFTVKYGAVGEDLVVQFFLPEALAAQVQNPKTAPGVQHYWLNVLPDVLSRVAPVYFRAEFPTVKAKYYEEVGSWWFQAQGFGQSLAVDRLARGFIAAVVSELAQPTGN